VTMTPEHEALRSALDRLAGHTGGRELLQLALRGLESDSARLDAGCWRRRGDAGCLFQQAYWQGVREGTFDDDGDARAWVSRVAGRDGWPRVIDAIDAFDRLARARYRAPTSSRVPGRPRRLDLPAWRAAVLDLLYEALAPGAEAVGTRPPVVIECAKL
jgi:hypothetical protein